MRNIFQSVLISLDGVVADPGPWAMPYFTEESGKDALAQLERSDAMLMGRTTYADLAARWRNDSGPFAQRMAAIPKYVFSSTLREPLWSSTTIVRGDPVAEVARLKDDGDGDLTTYGYGRLARTLLEAGLVDEMMLSIHPVVLGGSAPRLESPPLGLTLSGVVPRTSGVVVASYRVGRVGA
ncbi:dihydrofolate reductase [Nocardioides thalensis]|uniref:Dihydrofolate reductase n=1 Tax=Nocardioides thalensis TaxID=1914755 RepID=A0A853C923_9ACTN|nr:dihydrofolate reductase family protein [Nocardioides thalensis]NYJ02938.1 dihydrofolate reductase [Nocardioides thalensis]